MSEQPRTAREALRKRLSVFTDHSDGSIHADRQEDVEVLLDAILQENGWEAAGAGSVPAPLDVDAVERVFATKADALLHGTLESPREIAEWFAAAYRAASEGEK